MNQLVEIKELLKTSKLKATDLRVEVLAIILGFGKAIPYQEIQNSLQNFDRITLYRTLNILIERGILHKISMENNQSFYAMCTLECSTMGHQHQHVHFKCEQCNEVSCLETKEPIQLAIAYHLITDFEVMATGLCGACRL